MRLLVLDGSRVLHALVRRLAPPQVEVEEAASFEGALARLRSDPPQAVIVNLGPSELPWSDLKALCEQHRPPIPVLFESCVHRSAEEAGLGPLDETAAFLAKPYGLDELRGQIGRMLASVAAPEAAPPRRH